MPLHGPGPHPRVTGLGCVDELAERHVMGLGQHEQQFQRRLAPARLQPGQGAHGDPRLGVEVGQGRATLEAQLTQAGPHPLHGQGERGVVDHASFADGNEVLSKPGITSADSWT